jgi:hypothetical protein
MNSRKLTQITLTVAVLAILLAGSLAFLPASAQSASTTKVAGYGVGAVTCSSGGSPHRAKIYFAAEEKSGVILGGAVLYGRRVEAAINFTSGSVSTSSYSLSGAEYVYRCAGHGKTITTATVSGSCGSSVTISFTSANGESGTFKGSVYCSSS